MSHKRANNMLPYMYKASEKYATLVIEVTEVESTKDIKFSPACDILPSRGDTIKEGEVPSLPYEVGCS